MKLYSNKKIILCGLFWLLSWSFVKAQFTTEENISLAQEYFERNELDKAKEYYEKIVKDKKNLPIVYQNYLTTLTKLKDWKEAEKLCKKMMKDFEETPLYQIDLARLYEASAQLDKADKEYNKIIDKYKKQEDLALQAAEYFAKSDLYEFAAKMLLEARKNTKQKNTFALELADIYAMLDKTDEMLKEYILYATQSNNNIQTVKYHLQDNLRKTENFDKLENILLQELQKTPEEITYNELLLWLYLQQRRFSRAFVQAKALDKRYQMAGEEMLQIGRLALKNSDYEAASTFFEYVITTYPSTTSQNYVFARQLYLNAKEEVIKNTYPTNLEDIKKLIVEYEKMIDELGKGYRTLDAMRNMAMLKAFYLDQKKEAVNILNDALNYTFGKEYQIAQIKLDLGDIHLLLNEPWESTLFYSQVEKLQKEARHTEKFIFFLLLKRWWKYARSWSL
jgi:tetratricopeptide (TPR) repeat protein